MLHSHHTNICKKYAIPHQITVDFEFCDKIIAKGVNTINKKVFVIFVMGFLTTALALPLLSSLGVPSFDVVLTALFGEGNIWALVFSLTLILLATFGVGKAIKNYN